MSTVGRLRDRKRKHQWRLIVTFLMTDGEAETAYDPDGPTTRLDPAKVEQAFVSCATCGEAWELVKGSPCPGQEVLAVGGAPN